MHCLTTIGPFAGHEMIRRRQLSARLNLQPQKKEPTRLTDVAERIVPGSLAGNEALGRVAVPQAPVGVDPWLSRDGIYEKPSGMRGSHSTQESQLVVQ
jgi:hypothetical protein